jgi:hypothetical protein
MTDEKPCNWHLHIKYDEDQYSDIFDVQGDMNDAEIMINDEVERLKAEGHQIVPYPRISSHKTNPGHGVSHR